MNSVVVGLREVEDCAITFCMAALPPCIIGLVAVVYCNYWELVAVFLQVWLPPIPADAMVTIVCSLPGGWSDKVWSCPDELPIVYSSITVSLFSTPRTSLAFEANVSEGLLPVLILFFLAPPPR